MPIRINLLAEAIADEDLRRRDPVKRAIYGGAFVVALSLVWFSSIWLEYMVEKENLNRIEGNIAIHTNDYALVQSNLKKIGDVQHRMDSLEQLSAARFLQGNLMNALQQTYVPNVQLNRLRMEQTYSTTPGIPSKTNNLGNVVPGRPPTVTEHITLTIDAKDFSTNPGDQVNRYKDAIAKQEFLTPLLNPTNGVRLSGLSSLQTPSDSKPYVMFSLECRFLDRTP